jgi:hypothetical protein
MPLNIVSMAVYVTLEGKIPRTLIEKITTRVGIAHRIIQYIRITVVTL